jgi:amino acid adenylation domain-containing protein
MASMDELLGRSSAQKVPGVSSNLSIETAENESSDALLSEGQSAIWYAYRRAPKSAAYNLVASVTLRGRFELNRVEPVLDRLIRRHSELRSRFTEIDGTPRRRYLPPERFVMERVDATNFDSESRRRLWDELSDLPFDLQRGPLLRATLITLGPDEHTLHWAIHHIVADIWSLVLLMYEFVHDLGALDLRNRGRKRKDSRQFEDYVVEESAMLSGARGSMLQEYWHKKLKGAPTTLAIPFDFAPRESPLASGKIWESVADAELTSQIREFARRESTTPYQVCLTAFSVLLHQWTEQDDVLLGTPLHGRTAEQRQTIGYFANLVPIRSQCTAETSFIDHLHFLRQNVREAREYGDYPFGRIARELSHTAAGRTGPIQAVLAWQKAQKLDGVRSRSLGEYRDWVTFDGADFAFRPEVQQRGAPFEITVQIFDGGDALHIRWQYADSLFKESTIADLATQLLRILSLATSRRVTTLGQFSTASSTDLRRIEGWNNTATPRDDRLLLHELVARSVAAAPEATAVRFRDRTLTYRQLDNRAERLAERLRSHGVGPDSVIGVYLHRGFEMTIGLYGILKAAGAYLPLNPDDPWDRVAFQLRDAGAVAVISQAALVQQAGQAGLPLVVLDEMGNLLGAAPTSKSEPSCTEQSAGPQNLAYVIYTSGSTGRPKGVMIEHRAIVNRLLWMQEEYGLSRDDRVLQKTPYTFDVSVWEFFWTWLAGAELVMAEPGGHRDVEYLLKTTTRHDVTTLHFVPTMLRAFLQHGESPRRSSLRRVFASGETLPSELVDRFYGRYDAELHNLYGPTEAAIDVTAWHCPRDECRASVPIGRPIANTEIQILDDRLQPRAIGHWGELYIGGHGLARGYCNRPELTAERFISHPTRAGERLYRTGDVARWTSEGLIEFRGRTDNQVKIAGNRIELDEIAAVVAAVPGVEQAMVVVQRDACADAQIVAYLTVRPGSDVSNDVLRQATASRLPPYMVPGRFMTLTEMPLTAGGKIDRNSLPNVSRDRRESAVKYVGPRTQPEHALAAIVADVLKVDRVGVDDNLLDLGCASSQAVEIIGRAAAAGYALSVERLFVHPTIAGMVESLALPQPITGNVLVESLGVYLPPQSLSSADVMQGCSRKLSFPLEQLTGIRSRRTAGETEFSRDLAVRAVEECAARSRGDLREVDLVICCNISRCDGPNYAMTYEPSTAAYVCSQFGLDQALAFDISNACAGMFTGIALAEGMIRSGVSQRALVVSGEYITHLTTYAQRTIESDFDSRIPCLTLGDAGAAVLLEGSTRSDVGFEAIELDTLSRHSSLCIAKLTPQGPIMFTDMIGTSSAITQHGIDRWLRTMRNKGWSPATLQHMIPHQVSQTTIASGLNELRKAGNVDFREEVVISNVAERGNTATTSHWVAVWDQVKSGRIKSGDNAVFGVSGSGITVGTALYRFDDLPRRLLQEVPPRIEFPAKEKKPPTSPPKSTNKPVRRRRLDPRLRRVSAAGIGTARPADGDSSALGLARRAVHRALNGANRNLADVDWLIYTGIHRDEHISEPAFAVLLADALGRHADSPQDVRPFFAFDLLNGAVGFLQACYLAAQRIQTNAIDMAVVAAGEVEPNLNHLIGLAPGAGAMVLCAVEDSTEVGFGEFVFRNDWGNITSRNATTHWHRSDDRGPYDVWIETTVADDLYAQYIDLLVGAFDEILERERRSWDDVDWVLPPPFGPGFVERLIERVPRLRNKVVCFESANGDRLSTSVPFSFDALQNLNTTRREYGLIVSVGSGLQAAVASYHY